MQNLKPYVTIVIATYNRREKLPRCLDSVFFQTYPKDRYEIIVINGGSIDNTENVLREYEKTAPCRFIWISQKNYGISYARNTGISISKGDLVCFTDDDCIAQKDWIEKLVQGFINDSIGAVGGKVVSYQANTAVQQFVVDANILDQETFFNRNTLITANAAYRKKILTDIGGFDTHLIACEDLDISIKTQLLGFSLNYVPDAIVHHDHPATVKGLFSQQYRNGIGFVGLHRKYGQRFNLAYNTTLSWGRILFILLRYPITLISALVLKKKKYSVLEPLYYVICDSAFSWGIVRETIWGKEYRGYPVQSRISSLGFMENKPMSFLLQKILKKVQ